MSDKKWVTTDYKGDEKVWYSEDVILYIKRLCRLNKWTILLDYLRYVDGE